MSRLILVRHGQAVADRLTELGERQAQALAERYLREGIVFDAAWHGALERQRRTAAIVAAAYERAGVAFPTPRGLPELDEYPAEAIVERLAPRLAEVDADYAELHRVWREGGPIEQANARFQRMFEPAVRAWTENIFSDPNIELWEMFRNRIRSGLHAITEHAGRSAIVAAFTSGGPIGVIVQHALDAPPATALELNWRVRNASVTTLLFRGDRLSLDRFNDTAHLNKDELESFR